MRVSVTVVDPRHDSRRDVLIDAADDIDAIEELLGAGAEDTSATPVLQAIITTHRHWDHIRALPAAAKRHPAAMTIAGAADAAAIAANMCSRIWFRSCVTSYSQGGFGRQIG